MDKLNLKDLSDDLLADLQQQTADEVERRRSKPTLEDIKPGMTDEMKECVYAELRRVHGGSR